MARGSGRPGTHSRQGDPLTDAATRFIKACRLQPVDATPVWFMRQAGRYMSEYRALRERYSLLDLCRTPDLATEVTLQPIRRIDVDAAILFSDLLLPLEPMGVRFDFVRGEGPAIEQPLESEADLARVRRFDPRGPRGVPAIHFGVGTAAILRELRDAGGTVIGADWRTPLDEAWERIGYDRAIQGNLDPTLLLGPLDRMFVAADDILARAAG